MSPRGYWLNEFENKMRRYWAKFSSASRSDARPASCLFHHILWPANGMRRIRWRNLPNDLEIVQGPHKATVMVLTITSVAQDSCTPRAGRMPDESSSMQSNSIPKITVHEDADFARAALDAGGLGYVVKARLASDLLPAIRAALADRRFISPTISLEENA